jgi:hypothetical protein
MVEVNAMSIPERRVVEEKLHVVGLKLTLG